MTQSQLQPQSQQKGKMSGKGKPAGVSENTSSGGGTYNQSAGPMQKNANDMRPPPQPDQAQGMPKAPSAKIPPSIPKGTASYGGPESVRPKNAPSTGDRGVA